MRQFERQAAHTLCAALLAIGAGAASAAASFTPDATLPGWTSRPVLSSYNLGSGTEVLYRSSFNGTDWSGSLSARRINASGVAQTGSPWSTADFAPLLDTLNWDSGRRIATRNATGGNVAFRLASLSPSQQNAIGTNGAGLDNAAVLNFVRGDRSNEGNAGKKWRKRATRLGDIQHSTVLHWSYANGAKRLYFGANDGMLHAVDAATGSEVFAYVPSMLIGKLNRLVASPYTPTHFVDGPLAISEVTIGNSVRTLLAGGLGGGERGLFMLDVSDPTAADENAAAGKIKWEITPASTGFGNLGFSYAAPRFTRLNDSAKTPVLIVGNGYLNTGNGRASLFIINADTGALVREIDTNAGSLASPNGLSSPTVVDIDGNGTADFVYAGDIDGTLWKFDLTSSNSNNFGAASLHATSPARAITAAPAVYPHPNGGRMVLFGTGRTLSAADRTDSAVNHAYGIWDGAPAANTSLLAQTLSTVSANGKTYRSASADTPNWASGNHRGWQLTLGAGERVVGETPFVNEDRFYFSTVNPTIAAAGSGQPSGANWSLQVGALSGGNTGKSVFDINADGKINGSDKVQSQFVVGQSIGAGVASQATLVDLPAFSLTLFNLVNDGAAAAPSSTGNSGNAIFDIASYDHASAGNTTSAYKFEKAVSDYGTLYNAMGINLLNPSDPNFALSSIVTNTSNQFKVLVVNQYLNPAAVLAVGSSSYVPVKSYGGMTTAATASAMWNALPTYTRANIGTLSVAFQPDATTAKDWWGDGSVRAGLIPNQARCIDSKPSNRGVASPAGPNGERLNGALLVQIVSADTPTSRLELNVPGDPRYGWRVNAGSVNDNYSPVYGEYAFWWSAPNGKCYGETGWVPNPAAGTVTPSTATPPSGTTDPNAAALAAGGYGSVASVSSVSSSTSGATTIVTVTYSDGKTEVTTTTDNGNGTETVTFVGRDGNSSSGTRTIGGALASGTNELLVRSRRITWRELVSP